MTELLHCPFCGGEARIFHFSSAIRDEVWRAVCDKPFCAQGPDGYTEAEAIAAWNSRAERTCKLTDNGTWGYPYVCSACDASFDADVNNGDFNYCPNCGCKVVDEREMINKTGDFVTHDSGVERTCRQEERGWGTEGDHARVWLTCGHDCMVPTVQDLPNYCPECGAKVVEK